MSERQRPRMIRGDDTDFTRLTMYSRLPGVAQQVLDSIEWTELPARNLEVLIAEMPDALLSPIPDDGSNDVAQWNAWLAPYRAETWLTGPWLLTEFYFFRRILAATGFFTPWTTHGVDPFGPIKAAALLHEWDGIAELTAGLAEDLGAADAATGLRHRLQAALWGNQADLNLFAAGETPLQAGDQDRKAALLRDDFAAAADHILRAPAPRRVAIICDNTNIELTGDLALADYLLTRGIALEVELHLKPNPIYVSDARREEVVDLVAQFQGRLQTPTRNLGERLLNHLNTGRLQLATHWFWSAPLPMDAMPTTLQARLAQAHLTISKGDANYRRWLGDRLWAYETPLADVVGFFPAPLLLLRTLKSELLAGVARARWEPLAAAGPEWMVSSLYGVAQLHTP